MGGAVSSLFKGNWRHVLQGRQASSQQLLQKGLRKVGWEKGCVDVYPNLSMLKSRMLHGDKEPIYFVLELQKELSVRQLICNFVI
eukprot:snap_masked-scaffold_5-processed-gene-18.18-mRNA-1 protein AED:1.00 eAED:1.00 QI:0/-1/0/0/-1/1/1/0/84